MFTPHGAWKTDDDEIEQWVQSREQAAWNNGSVAYFPRIKHRLTQEPTSVGLLVSHIDVNIGQQFLQSARELLTPVHGDDIFAWIKPEVFHVTYAFMKPGVDRASDVAMLSSARALTERVVNAATAIQPACLEPFRFLILQTQLMVVYRAAGWNCVTDAAAMLRDRIPEFDGGYPPQLGPLQMGPVVQTTLGAVKHSNVDLQPAIALTQSYRPNWSPFQLRALQFVEHIHNPTTVLDEGELFAEVVFGS